METLEQIKELTELISVDATKFFKGNKKPKELFNCRFKKKQKQHQKFIYSRFGKRN